VWAGGGGNFQPDTNMKHENENSLQTAARWGWNGVKVAYAGYAVGSVLFPRQPAPKASRAQRLEELEENDEKFDDLLEERKELQEAIKVALTLTIDDEDSYLNSAQFIAEKAQELTGIADHLADEDNFRGAKKAQCRKIVNEMLALWETWGKILTVRKHQAYLAEEAFQVKIGAKSAAWSAYEKSCYTLDKIIAAIVWTVILAGGSAFVIAVIYQLCQPGTWS
jgi:hypothetical protein